MHHFLPFIIAIVWISLPFITWYAYDFVKDISKEIKSPNPKIKQSKSEFKGVFTVASLINVIPVVGIIYMVYEKSFSLTLTSIVLITILLKILTFKLSKSFLISALSVFGFIKLSNILKLYVESKKGGI